jgi:hypothetical protein
VKKDERFRPHQVYKNAAGKRVVGVTTALSELGKPYLVPWANKLGLQGIDSRTYVDETAQAGKLAHAMILDEIRGIKPDLHAFSQYEIDAAENSFIKYLDWRKRHDVQPIHTEQGFVSERYQYGGTIDCYCLLDGRPTLVDFKTSKDIYDEHWYQVAAYRQLLEEASYSVDEVRILQIGRANEGDFQERHRTDTSVELRIFLAALEIYNLKKLLKGESA